MAIIVADHDITKEDLEKARENYPNYIKITADILKKIVLIGGEYHSDSEKILVEQYASKQSNIWGGGYNIETNRYEYNAILNIHQNGSPDILDPKTRRIFLEVVKEKLGDIKSLL